MIPVFYTPQIVNHGSNPLSGKVVIDVALSSYATFALTQDNELYSWGLNDAAVLGDPAAILSEVRELPGLVKTTGALAGKIIVSIKASSSAASALTSDGKIFVWGDASGAQLGIGSTGSTRESEPTLVDTTGALYTKVITTHCMGPYHMAAIDTEGVMYSWGLGDGANGDGTTATRNSAVFVNATGFDGYRPESVVCGASTMLAVGSKGTEKAVFGWGDPGFKELGATGTAFSPTRMNVIPASSRTVLLAASPRGYPHTVILARKSATAPPPAAPAYNIYVSGSNRYGAVGDGTALIAPQPFDLSSVSVLADKFVTKIIVGETNTFAITSDNIIYGWVREK
jgi:alpha-tubulin suppressor-like RCC1 family protein